MQFSQIIAQQEVKHRLKELVQKNRLSHALLFLGRDGSGALPLALAFAQYILCEKVNPPADPGPSLFGSDEKEVPLFLEDSCGVCPSCVKAGQLIHPDLHFSYPAVKRDSRHDRVLSTDYIAEWRRFIQEQPYSNVADWINFLKDSPSAKIEQSVNKQGNITVSECDDISHKLSLKSFESPYKILILWMPEFLGPSGNKLLKLVEEPPPHTIFILVAEDESAILPTLVSRTQLIKIPPCLNADIKDALVNQYDTTPEKASRIAAISEGNFREALLLLQHTEEDLLTQLREWLNLIVRNNASGLARWIDQVSKTGREKQKQFLKYFIHLIRQSVRVQYLSDEDLVSVPGSEKDFAVRLNKMCSLEAQDAMAGELERAMYYIERNAHAKMLFHALSIRFFHIIKDNSLILIH